MRLSSPDFSDDQKIPARFTCEGDDVSPTLEWTDVPESAASLALTCEDPDAPGGTFVHWVIWGIDPRPGRLASGEESGDARQGRNDFGKAGYGGPCPPPGHGIHHYHFTLYACNEPVSLRDGASIDDLRRALTDTTVAEATLTGIYER